MKKLKLDLESVTVESFATGDKADLVATVNGMENTQFSCNISDDDYTCWDGCQNSNAPADTCWSCDPYRYTCGFGGTSHCRWCSALG